jgi:hypothetical protein
VRQDRAGAGAGEPACRIGGPLDGPGGLREPQDVALDDEDGVGRRGVQGEGLGVGQQTEGGDRPAGRDARQQVARRAVVAQPVQQRRRGDRLDQRAGHRVAAQFREGHGEFDRERAESLVALGNGQGEDVRLGEPGPQGAAGRAVARRPGPHGGRGVRRRQHGVQGAGEVPLPGVEEEPHQRRPFGRPSSRSAMMSRWISLVPA